MAPNAGLTMCKGATIPSKVTELDKGTKDISRTYEFTPGNVNGIQQVLRDMGVKLEMPITAHMRFSAVDLSFEFCIARAMLIAEIGKEKPNSVTIERAIRLIVWVVQTGTTLQGCIPRAELLDLMQSLTRSVQEHCKDPEVSTAIGQDMAALAGRHLIG